MTSKGQQYQLTLTYGGEYRPPGFGGQFIFYEVFIKINGQDLGKLSSGELTLPYLDGKVGATITIAEERFHIGAEVRNRRVDVVRLTVRQLP